ncbi:MAG: rod shape-determining protein MreD [Bacteroidales bacterium]|nr:rod shape-determining protein MreD [Bacteroidales bacterium]
MNNLVWRNIGRFILLMLLQIVVFNNISLWGYILPMVYVLFILMLPTGTPRIPMLLIAFATGLVADIFNNMMGFHACACLVVAMCRILFGNRIITRNESAEIDTPSIFSAAPQYFVGYLMLMLSIFYFVLFSIEMFDFRGFWQVLLATILSTIATTAIAVLYQLAFISAKKQ